MFLDYMLPIGSFVTAISALVAPIVVAAYNTRSVERIRRLETRAKTAFEAVSSLATSYANLTQNGSLNGLWGFTASAYNVLAVLPFNDIQRSLQEIIQKVHASGGVSTDETNQLFSSLMVCLSSHLATYTEAKK